MFSGGPSLSARLANIQHMPVLIAATIASEKPTDGYLVKDIVKMSYESPQTRAFLQQYLLNQLVTSRNVYVKMKVLKLLEELLEKGHIEFKQNLRKQPEPLNEASRLRSNHSKDGGLITECARIRDLSNKLLEMLYSDAPELQRKRYPSPEYRPAQDTSSSSATRMEGFGNTSYVSPRGKSSTTSDKLKTLFGSSSKATPLVYDESYATMDPVPHNVNAGSGSVQYGGYGAGVGHAPGRHLEHRLLEGAPHRSGEAGGGWGTNTNPPPPPPPPQPVPEQVVREDNHVETAEDYEDRNTEQERRLVDDITAPGGIKAAPPRDSLNKFISRCKVLDCLAIVEFLRQKLLEEQTQVVLRTLFVLEAMLRSDVPDIFSYLDLVLEELTTLTHSSNTSIKAKAKKILHQLTVEDSPGVTSSNTGSSTRSGFVGVASNSGMETILDLGGGGGGGAEGEGGGGSESVEQEISEEAQSTGAQGLFAGLFAGMSLSGQPPSTPPTVAGRPSHTHQQQKKKVTSSPVAQRSQEVGEDGSGDNAAPFEDLLGLTSSEVPSTQSALATVAGCEGEAEEVPLMDLGEDDNFDPLMRTGSVGSRSNSLTRTTSLGSLKATPTAPPTTPGSETIMGQLSGLDLSLPHSSQSDASSAVQNGLGTNAPGILQPFQINSSLIPISSSPSSLHTTSISSSSGPTSLLPGVATPQSVGVVMGGASVVNYGGVQMTGRLAYMPATVPYGMQPIQGGMPAYSTAQGPAMLYMNQPRLGGDSRPVQRPQVNEVTPESSFDFLGKSSKGSAFDFVKEEIDSAKKK